MIASACRRTSKSATPPVLELPPTDPVEAAKAAQLRYVSDEKPGVRRVRSGKGFRYVGTDGKPVRDPATLARIRHLAIPPAWTDVWICPQANGHIQATGRDARGRKQYRYHERWRVVRDETKYGRLVAFAHALPRLRKRIEEDLAQPGMPREKVVAAVVRLLETTLIRVGNEEYAKANRSYGLTTLRNHHVEVEGGTIQFRFRGKSGIRHTVAVSDRRLARIVRKCQELPGHDLFEHLDENGEAQPIDSADVNEYLRAAMGEEFTAKDFRTWAGTVLAAQALRALASFDSQTEAKRNVVAAVEQVAARLGNTKAVCRKCYVHPAIFDAYLEGGLVDGLTQQIEGELMQDVAELPEEEAAVLAFLHRRLADEAKKSA